MAILKNTTISGTGFLTVPSRATSQRPLSTTTVIRWTNTGTQSGTVLRGNTPTFSNTGWTAPTGVNRIEVLVVAGGGGGGIGHGGGGGGAGGVIYNSSFSVTPGISYTVTVGAGGSSGASLPTAGSNSVFGSLTAIGGGYGGSENAPQNGGSGGCGGGGSGYGVSTATTGGAGTAGQGYPGGGKPAAHYGSGAGGGGAGGRGGDCQWGAGTAADIGTAGGGGPGVNYSISGTPTWYGGGGGGGYWGADLTKFGAGGIGGGGNGGSGSGAGSNVAATAGTASTGGGGGGSRGEGSITRTGAAGGSGVVIIKYETADDSSALTGSISVNSEMKGIEFYSNAAESWVSQDPTSNFAGHNLFTFSNNWTLGSAHWIDQRGTPTSTSTVTAPDGTSTAFRIGASSGRLVKTTGFTITAGNTYVWSLWVRVVSGSGSIAIWSGTSGGAAGTTNFIADGVWRRYSASVAVTGANDYSISFGSGTVLELWGSQLELGTLPGPYSPTNGVISPAPSSLGGYRTHAYLTTGTSSFKPALTGTVEVLVVAGGGAGGAHVGGGGGGGGVIYNSTFPVISNREYTVTVGAGGLPQGADTRGGNGGNSVFGPLVAIGGGGGGTWGGAGPLNPTGFAGGSGGGAASAEGSQNGRGGAGVVGQGHRGGFTGPRPGTDATGAGGGGAGGPAADRLSSGDTTKLNGGPGLPFNILGRTYYFAGGGGPGAYLPVPAGDGGAGGGGGGAATTGVQGYGDRLSINPAGDGSVGSGTTAGAGATNSGGGGGGGPSSSANSGAAGGSGIVVVRYKYN